MQSQSTLFVFFFIISSHFFFQLIHFRIIVVSFCCARCQCKTLTQPRFGFAKVFCILFNYREKEMALNSFHLGGGDQATGTQCVFQIIQLNSTHNINHLDY